MGAPVGRDARPPKVAVIGAGAVGATITFATLMRGAARHVALDDIEVCRDADLVVVTAGAKQRPGQSRTALAQSTVGLVRTVVPEVVRVAPEAVILLVTNPVDVVTQAALQVSGLPTTRVFGAGTVLDTSRLRQQVARAFGVVVGNIHAWVVGEHGDTEIPLWSSAMVGAVPLLDWSSMHPPLLDEASRTAIAAEVVGSAYRVIEGKGATNYAVALAVVTIIEAVLRDEGRVLSVSTMLEDYQGIGGVCLSVPTVVGRRGAGARWRSRCPR